jgi:hypothetical protein
MARSKKYGDPLLACAPKEGRSESGLSEAIAPPRRGACCRASRTVRRRARVPGIASLVKRRAQMWPALAGINRTRLHVCQSSTALKLLNP